MREAQFLKQNADKWKQYEAELNTEIPADTTANRHRGQHLAHPLDAAGPRRPQRSRNARMVSRGCACGVWWFASVVPVVPVVPVTAVTAPPRRRRRGCRWSRASSRG